MAKAENIALYADGTLRILNDVQMINWAGAVNAGEQQTEIAAGAITGDLWSAAPVNIQSNAIVAGIVEADAMPAMQVGARILNGYHPLEKNLQHLTWNIEFPNANDWANVEPTEEKPLPPGNYIGGNPKGTALMTSGEYYFGDLHIEPGAMLHLDQSAGPIIIHVQGLMTYRGSMITNDGSFPRVLFAIFGQSASFFESDFKGRVVAPNGTIVLGTANFEGAFWGHNIEVRAGSTVTFRKE